MGFNPRHVDSNGLQTTKSDGRKGLLILALFFCLATISITPWDAAISQGLRRENFQHWSGDLVRIVDLSEVFAQGVTVFLFLSAIYYIDITNRPLLKLTAILTILGGVTANVSKSIFTRIRPHAMETIAAGQSEGGWMPMLSGSFWDATHRSFPSGHAATAVALACGLTMTYPRGRWFFVGFAALACLQRIVAGAHYPSDIFAGGAIGCIAAVLCSLIHDQWMRRKVSVSARRATQPLP